MAIIYFKFFTFLFLIIHFVSSQLLSEDEIVIDFGELPDGWYTDCKYIHEFEDIKNQCLSDEISPNQNIGYWLTCERSTTCHFSYTYPIGFIPKLISIRSLTGGNGGYIQIFTANFDNILDIKHSSSEWKEDRVNVNQVILHPDRSLYFSFFGQGVEIIDQIRVTLAENSIKPTDMYYTLDTFEDESINWVTNCHYFNSFVDLSEQNCFVAGNPDNIECDEEGFWSNCMNIYPYMERCQVVFNYDERIFQPTAININAILPRFEAWIRVWTLNNDNIAEYKYQQGYPVEWGNYILQVHQIDLSEDHKIYFEFFGQTSPIVWNMINVSGLKLSEESPTTQETSTLIYTDTPVPCRQTDAFGNIWEGSGCQMEVRECPVNQTGNGIFWFCGCDGIFEGDQPQYNCNPDWIGNFEDELENSLIDYPDGLPSNLVNYFLEEIEVILRDVKAHPNDNPDLYYGQHIGRTLNLIEDIAMEFECNSENVGNLEKLTSRAINATTSILTFDIPWGQLSEKDRAKEITHLIQNYERVTYHLLVSRIDGEESYITDFGAENEIHLVAGVENKINSQRLKLPSDTESYFELPDGWTDFYQNGNIKNDSCSPEKPENPRFTGFQILSNLIKDKVFNLRNTDKEIFGDTIQNGNLMTFSFLTPSDDKITILKDGLKIKIRFKHDARASHNSISGGKFKRESALCVFWDENYLNWSKEGCGVVQDESDGLFTTCECNHLTSFAMLMGVHEDDKILRILTAIFCGISNIFLGITIYVLLSTKSMANTQGHISLHICSTLFLGNILLVFMNPAFFTEIPKVFCLTTGVALHLVFLWAWAWMASLAFHLFHLVNSMSPNVGQTTPTSFYKLCAYGFPLAWVIGVAGITRMGAYSSGEEDFCWLKGNYIWTFLGPMTIIIIFNTSVLGYAFWRANKMNNSPLRVQNSVKDKRTSILGWIHLSITFGLTWGFGYFVIISHSIFFAYAFAILNGLQGFFIFIFHYILKEHFKAALKKKMSSIATISGFTSENTRFRSKSNPHNTSRSNANNSHSGGPNANFINKKR